MSVDEERARLEREAESLVTMEDPEVEQRLIDVYERCGRANVPHGVAHQYGALEQALHVPAHMRCARGPYKAPAIVLSRTY